VTPEKVSTWISALGGRRYLLCIGCALINTVIYASGLPMHAPMSESGYLMIISGTVITYVGANVTQKIKNKEDDK
jgi:hypothetical protein